MQKMLQFNQRSVLLGAEGGVSKGRAKYGKMENELKRSNQDYIDSTVQEQQVPYLSTELSAQLSTYVCT